MVRVDLLGRKAYRSWYNQHIRLLMLNTSLTHWHGDVRGLGAKPIAPGTEQAPQQLPVRRAS